jgi:hypothetical protein
LTAEPRVVFSTRSNAGENNRLETRMKKMIFTISRPYHEITEELGKHSVISLISCNNCVRACGTGGQLKMQELAQKLKGDGYNVRDGFLLTKACPQPYMGIVRLAKAVDTLVVLACYAGCSNAKRRFPDLKVVQTTEDVGLPITDSDSRTLELVMAFAGHEKLLGKRFEIGTGKPL